MSTDTEALDFAALPALGQPLAGGAFAGITTLPDGSHVAVTLLPEQATFIPASNTRARLRV